MAFFENNGVKIYYEISGKGEPVIFIGGLGMTCEGWFFQKNYFSKYYQVILVDNRGSGRSDTPDYNFTIDDMAEDIYCLMEILSLKQSHIVSTSMGGFISLKLAYKYPEKIKSLVLSNTAAKISDKSIYRLKFWEEMRDKNVDLSIQIKEQILWIFPEIIFSNMEVVNNIYRQMKNFPFKQSDKGYKKQLNACLSFDATGFLDKISSSTLICASTDDLIIPFSEAKKLHEKIKNSKLIIFNNSGHIIHTIKSSEFNKIVSDFFNGTLDTSCDKKM